MAFAYLQTNQLWIAKLPVSGSPAEAYGRLEWVKVAETFEASYDYVANDGSVFMLVTDLEAPKRRIVTIDTAVHGGSWND